MGIFGTIGDQAVGNTTVYLGAGEYLLSVGAVKLVESKRTNDSYFVVEGEVTSSKGEDSTPKGTYVSWLCRMGGQYPETALRDVKGCLMAITGAANNEVTEDFVEKVLENDGELLWDKVVRVKVEEKPTKSGGVFSKHYWSRE